MGFIRIPKVTTEPKRGRKLSRLHMRSKPTKYKMDTPDALISSGRSAPARTDTFVCDLDKGARAAWSLLRPRGPTFFPKPSAMFGNYNKKVWPAWTRAWPRPWLMQLDQMRLNHPRRLAPRRCCHEHLGLARFASRARHDSFPHC